MTKIDWAAKLTSRKFWMAICGFVSGILLAFKVSESEVSNVTGIIMAGASVIAYILGEGLADAAGAKGDTYIVRQDDKPPLNEEDDGR